MRSDNVVWKRSIQIVLRCSLKAVLLNGDQQPQNQTVGNAFIFYIATMLRQILEQSNALGILARSQYSDSEMKLMLAEETVLNEHLEASRQGSRFSARPDHALH